MSTFSWLVAYEWEVFVLSKFRHKTSTAEDSRPKGSALALPAAFADINIAKDSSVYSIV
jgi:hypothetical protein